MPPAREQAQERGRLGGVCGLAHDPAAKRHRGIGAEHHLARRHVHRGGLFCRDPAAIVKRGFARMWILVDIRRAHGVGIQAERRQQLRAARAAGAKDQGRLSGSGN